MTGELLRFPLLGFDFLPSDVFLMLLLVFWSADKLKNDRRLRLGKVSKMLILFLLVITINYFIGFFRFDFAEMKSAFFYLARLGLYFLLMPIAFDLIQRHSNYYFQKRILALFTLSFVLLVIFGFLQLKYFPDFLELGLHLDGWDPHIGRLLSTWFDPNFFGGYLAFFIPLLIALALYFYHQKKRGLAALMIIVVFMGLMALYFTFSRSGYLAFMAAVSVLAFLKTRKLLLAGLLIVVLAFSISPRVQQRTLEAWDSGKALLGLDSQKPLDPTAELRVWSWKFAWEMIGDYPWLGVVYNRYPFEINKRGHGLLSDHASGGSDSSLLTIWATTGIFGLLSYLSIAFTASVLTIKRIWKKADLRSYADSGLLAGFAGLMLHSFFVNSLLFAFMMVYLMPALALLDER